MKSLLITGILLAVMLSGCSKEPPIPDIPEEYSSWTRMNKEELNYPIPGHEENYRIIYINETGEEARFTENSGTPSITYPKGTIIVKEIYKGFDIQADAKPNSLTVMIKDPDYPDSRSGWIWLVKDLNTGTKTVISQEFCVTCHSNANEKHSFGGGNPGNEFRDYAFFTPPGAGLQ